MERNENSQGCIIRPQRRRVEGEDSPSYVYSRRGATFSDEMSRSAKDTSDNTLSKLLTATNSFHVDDEFSSKFTASIEERAKFSPNNLIQKMATLERDSSICASDCRFLVKFYLHSTSNSRFNVTSEGHAEYDKLVKKYGVEKKAKGDNITLHRIASSFPVVAVSLLRQFKIDRKFSTEMLKARDAGEFPWSMRTQMCLSLAPTGAPYVSDPDHYTLMFGIVAFMYYENRTVNNTKQDASPSASFEISLNIAYACYKNSNLDEEMKRDAWNHVVYDYNAGRESVNGLLQHFRREIPDAPAAFKKRFELGVQPANPRTAKRGNYFAQNPYRYHK